MARKPNPEKPVRKIFSLPESVAAKLELFCKNPMTGKAYADNRSQSKLVERLLREFFADKTKMQQIEKESDNETA